MTKAELIEALLPEIDRVLTEAERATGARDDYNWLTSAYGISEEDDALWLDILADEAGELDLRPGTNEYYPADNAEEEAFRAERLRFLDDDQAVCLFLESLLHRLRSQ